MKILVCVKQVPESDTDIQITPAGDWVVLPHRPALRMNRYDACAVELAVRLKEADPEVRVDALTVGPGDSDAVLRRAMGMGADDGIHLMTDAQAYVSPFRIAAWIAGVASRADYDLILTGVMSEDLMQGLVGPLTAKHLGIPCATAVTELTPAASPGQIMVERELEGGYHERRILPLPALATIQSGVYEPRYPALSKLLRANRRELDTRSENELPAAAPRVACRGAEFPQKTRAGRVLEGSTDEKARQLYQIFQDKSILG